MSILIDPAAPEPKPRPPSPWRRLLDGLRLTFLRTVPDERLAASWGTVFGMAVITVLFPILVSLWIVGPRGEWNWYALPFVLFHLPLVLGAAIAAAYALRTGDDVPRLFYVALLIYLVLDAFVIGTWALTGLAGGPSRLFQHSAWVASLWLGLAFATYAARRVERGVRRLAVIGIALVFLALPLATLYRERTPWHVPYADPNAARMGRMGIASEAAFYRQPELLARELAAVQPGRKGVIDVFFIGVAGFGGQDVFMREVNSVTRLFKERFGAEGRAIRLVNNPRSVLDTPIASATSLKAALNRVAEAMNADEDVLVLYLTSHGSETHRFALDLWPMRFNELDPATLRAAMDDAGIRNRVVIISACYSGGFVEPLRNPDTVVITAAAADRVSFGCSNEADWTYFGKAYFDEALRRTHSFTKAFEDAKPVIAQREKKDGYDPSNPQMAVGAAIAAKLAALERQLDKP